MQQRLDQWLVFTRFAKTRELAKILITKGKLRINQHKRADASAKIKEEDLNSLSPYT